MTEQQKKVAVCVFCYIWKNLQWFLGLIEANLAYVATINNLSARTLIYIMVASGIIHSTLAYIKSNPLVLPQPGDTK